VSEAESSAAAATGSGSGNGAGSGSGHGTRRVGGGGKRGAGDVHTSVKRGHRAPCGRDGVT
jgi:hypothetical protein